MFLFIFRSKLGQFSTFLFCFNKKTFCDKSFICLVYAKTKKNKHFVSICFINKKKKFQLSSSRKMYSSRLSHKIPKIFRTYIHIWAIDMQQFCNLVTSDNATTHYSFCNTLKGVFDPPSKNTVQYIEP